MIIVRKINFTISFIDELFLSDIEYHYFQNSIQDASTYGKMSSYFRFEFQLAIFKTRLQKDDNRNTNIIIKW